MSDRRKLMMSDAVAKDVGDFTNPTRPAKTLDEAQRYAERQGLNMYQGIPLDPGAVLRAREFPEHGSTLTEGLPSTELCEEALRTGRQLLYVRRPGDGKPILMNPAQQATI